MGILDYLQHKISSAIGGLLGGTSALRFFHAKTPTDAFYRGALSIIFSVVFGIPVLAYFNLPYQNWEWQLASGFVCGFIGYSLMSASAEYFAKAERENKDLIDLASELSIKSTRVVRKRTPSKKKKVRKGIKK
jgi:hypothetical protein